uniref:thioesterase family protein n=1 Tax=Eubacterium sp. TaxID=142586 RepID=UPI003FEE9FDB
MKEIQLNAEASVSLEVTDDNTAVAAGSGSLRVLGTPFMIALMEKATCNAVHEFLEFGETTVGTCISVSHDKASGVGEIITAFAKITAAEGRKITFSVYAENESGDVIGKGVIERFVVKSEKFISKVYGD